MDLICIGAYQRHLLQYQVIRNFIMEGKRIWNTMVLMIIPLIKEFNSHAVDPTYIVMQQCNILFPFFLLSIRLNPWLINFVAF